MYQVLAIGTQNAENRTNSNKLNNSDGNKHLFISVTKQKRMT